MASPAFERFRFSFFEDPNSPRNGLDVKALAALEAEERSRAEDMLLQYLPDTRAVIGLGALGSRRAWPALVRLFEASQGSDGSGQVYLAKALWQIQPNPRWLDAVIEVLASADEPMQRLTAAEALYHSAIPSPWAPSRRHSMIPRGWCGTTPPADCSRSTPFPTIPKTRST
jgi:hypothetical protein